MYQALCQVQEIKLRASPCHHEAQEADEGTGKQTNNIVKNVSFLSFIDKEEQQRMAREHLSEEGTLEALKMRSS